ncbi:MAG: AAA family ATPase [Opitutaceae bacterium]
MKSYPTINECRGYVSALCHSHESGSTLYAKRPAVTISRQAGARGRSIAHELQKSLNAESPNAQTSWALFDENLVQKVLEDNDLPAELEKFMPEDAVSELQGSINEILGRHPSLWALFEKTTRTIVRLSHLGRCIIVGRGGNLITHGLSNVLRVRLIGSEANRIHQMVNVHGMTEDGAKKFVKEEDVARRDYVKQHFNSDIDDPHTYDLAINTDHLSDERIVGMLTSAVHEIGKLDTAVKRN